MAKKYNQELMELDIYELLHISIDSNETTIKKAYRQKALACHPDKNPDKPNAADEFDRLKKILEILLDSGARTAYDRVLKGRKAAAVRARESSSKTQKLKRDLEDREKRADTQRSKSFSEAERFRRELKRLEEEGERLIEEELENINRQVEEEIRNSEAGNKSAKNSSDATPPKGYRIKAKWLATDDWPGYSKEEIKNLFYKWGEITALVYKQKNTKGTALVEYLDKNGADMAFQFEKGQIGKPVEVTHVVDEPAEKKLEPKPKLAEIKTTSSRDYESIAAMNQRRMDERRKLIEEMMKEDQM